MTSSIYLLNFNDITKTNLALNFSVFSQVSDNASLAPPDITELGHGFYKFGYDLDNANSDIYYVADDGSGHVLTGVIAKSNNDTLVQMLNRLLGLCYENQRIDNAVYDGNGNLTSCRLRLYSVAGSVGSDNDVLATYNAASTYSGNALQTFQVVKV